MRYIKHINLHRYHQNLVQVRRSLAPQTKLIAVVKANAYGHGLLTISREAIAAGVDMLCVAIPDEALCLRSNGIDAPILLFSEPDTHRLPDLLANRITLSVYSQFGLQSLIAHVSKKTNKAKVHVKVNTGMNRLGLHGNEIKQLLTDLSKENIQTEGLYTHLARSEDVEDSFNQMQLEIFSKLIQHLKEENLCPPLCHALNSFGSKHFQNYHLNAVRIGYQGYVDVMSIESQVSYLHYLKAGEFVGYGSSYQAKTDQCIAVLPIGYGDGIPQELSNRGHVLIKGKRYPIVGRICMDMMMCNLGDNIENILQEEAVIVLGQQSKEHICCEEIATQCNIDVRAVMCYMGSERRIE